MLNCKQCKSAFEITDGDRAFYKKMDVPEPTLCPDCRQQRRLAFRNEQSLYRRKCDLCDRNITSQHRPDAQHPVYCHKCWYGDKWTSLDYGREYDFERPFFEQYRDLFYATPHSGIWMLDGCENCEFTNYMNEAKNCYLTFGSGFTEDCGYAAWTYYAKDSFDTLGSTKIEQCYQLVDCRDMYGSTYCQDCSNLSDCDHCYNCQACQNCFGCVGLRNKQYCFLNEQLSKEQYEEKIRNYDQKIFERKFESLKLERPRKAAFVLKCEKCTGDYLTNCKGVTDSFNVINSEDCRFHYDILDNKDSYDINRNGFSELCYEVVCGGYAYHCLFCGSGAKMNNCQYSFFCFFCDNLFGCVGLRHKKYCIFNKQYSKEEYEELKKKIVEQMRKNGEYGEFFPASLSSFGYNETVTNDFFPLTKEEAIKKGFNWSDYESPRPDVKKTISAADLPDDIKDIPDDILNWAIKCEITKRPFRIIPMELSFYRQHNLPIPHKHPDIRHRDRMNLRNPRRLWERKCDNCQKDIQTTYSPDRPEKVYCENCYLKEVY